MSKNAYEIRKELLYLAYQLVKEKKEMAFRNHMENNVIREKNGLPPTEIPMGYVSEDDVFELAESLNAFVSKKDT